MVRSGRLATMSPVLAGIAAGALGVGGWLLASYPAHTDRLPRTSLATASASSTSPAPASVQRASVEAVVARALEIDQTLPIPPVPVNKAAAVSSTADVPAAPAPGDAVRAKQIANADTAIESVFDAAGAVNEKKALNNAITMERDPNFRALAAGVSNIRYKDVEISGSLATVTGVVTVWSKTETFNNGRWLISSPSSDLEFQMTLVADSSGHWKVHSYSWTFAAGSEP